MKKDLSVIMVSYNTKDLTLLCIQRIQNSLKKSALSAELVIVDNNSSDGSSQMLKALASQNSSITVIYNSTNNGFGKANNQGLAVAQGRYVLYLNSDVLIPEEAFLHLLIKKMDVSSLIGGLTVRVNLSSGTIDPASHRGFPTVWRSLCYYTGLEKVTKNIPLLNRLFGGYHLTYLSLKTAHEIDTPTGAFFLVKKAILDVLGGFDEDFFMYGEDIDLSFRIKRLGYSIVYDPIATVIHLKNQSGMKKKHDAALQKSTRAHFYEAMAIFYQKHYEQEYPWWVSQAIYSVIRSKKGSI